MNRQAPLIRPLPPAPKPEPRRTSPPQVPALGRPIGAKLGRAWRVDIRQTLGVKLGGFASSPIGTVIGHGVNPGHMEGVQRQQPRTRHEGCIPAPATPVS